MEIKMQLKTLSLTQFVNKSTKPMLNLNKSRKKIKKIRRNNVSRRKSKMVPHPHPPLHPHPPPHPHPLIEEDLTMKLRYNNLWMISKDSCL
jgi:hypothetical protein